MASSKSAKTGRLILHDALTAPGQSVILTADLLEEHFLRNSGLGGEVLLFEEQGRVIGQAMTGGDGRAMKEFRPATVGATTISVRLADTRRVTTAEATARLFVWDRRRQLTLIALRALLPRVSRLFSMADGDSKIPDPDPQAAKMLSYVGRRLGVIYMDKADVTDLPGIREWQERHHLPAGPIVLLKRGGIGAELQQLEQQGWAGIKKGLVSSPEEAKELLAAGKIAIASPLSAAAEKWPQKTIKPKDWEEVGKRLLP